MSVFEILISFLLFMVLQSWFINGVYDCFKGKKVINDTIEGRKEYYQGQIFYKIAPKFFEKHRHKIWSQPLWTCIRCMASFWGGLTYWPVVIWLFGFDWIEVWIYIFDVFILVYLNVFFYNRQ